MPSSWLSLLIAHCGFAFSRSDAEGGDVLARPANRLEVGEITRFAIDPIALVDCVSVFIEKPSVELIASVIQNLRIILDQLDRKMVESVLHGIEWIVGL
jgi:DNA-binding IscR family transcriptional regulator